MPEVIANSLATLDCMRPGQAGVIRGIAGGNLATQRLLEMGLTEGEPVDVVALAPLGDPMEIRVRGFDLSLRRRDAALVTVDAIDRFAP